MLMRFILLGILVLVLVSLYFFYPLYKATRVSKEIQQHTAAYEQHPAHPTLHILVAGDSTGFGTGASDPKDSIAGRIGQDLPAAEIRNISVFGDTLSQMNEKLSAQGNTHYDLILFQIGANDITGMTSYTKIRSELSHALDFAQAHASSTVVMTSGDVGSAPVFRYPLSLLMTHRSLRVREIFKEAVSARPSATYIDLYEDPAHNVFNTDIGKYYAQDRFHPSSDGYAEWYTYLQPVIRSLHPSLSGGM